MLWMRVVHILAGIFWVGSMVFIAAFLLPTARAAGADGGRFMQRLMQQRKVNVALGIAALLTVLTGLGMYGRLSAGFQRAWVTSPHGLVLAVGGLAALAAVVVGGALNGPAAARLGRLQRRFETEGGVPSPAEVTQINALSARLQRGAVVVALLLVVAAAAMASARYL
jgi:uncharacterized membrane protein